MFFYILKIALPIYFPSDSLSKWRQLNVGAWQLADYTIIQLQDIWLTIARHLVDDLELREVDLGL